MDQYDVCLIDTVGCSHKNKEQLEDIKKLLDQVPISEREVYFSFDFPSFPVSSNV